jgi:hypothetical protein
MAPVKSPGTGPVRVLTFPTVIVLFVTPGTPLTGALEHV